LMLLPLLTCLNSMIYTIVNLL